ncbi:MAG: hypothetical protein ACTS8Z_05020 [Candidatus Limnocylindrales bacterium]
MVVGSVLSTALALVALPGIAGSGAPSALEPVPAGAFQSLSAPASSRSPGLSIGGLDGDFRSAAAVHERSRFIEPGEAPEADLSARPDIDQPEVGRGSARKPPKSTLTGQATFYHNGTTAMRLPRGTVVIICGDGGCVERTVNDYGPQAPSRIVDLYVDDFFAICGCPSWSGITDVTVYVY